MKIAAVGNDRRILELQNRLFDFDITVFDNLSQDQIAGLNADVIFDLNFDISDRTISMYKSFKNPVIISCVNLQLAQLLQNDVKNNIIGMNCLPTFIDRNIAEVSLPDNENTDIVKSIFKQLNWEYLLVKDRVGMVTSRVIFMIINEACYTLQEGTASIKDIDLGMKLGTNYPYGPFEWADKIGIENIYQTLTSLYEDTKDERYKICPLLKTQVLSGKKFYPQ